MTALTKYARLETTGLWRETPDGQRREVIVRMGDATLMLTDPKSETVLSHWSLPAVRRQNPGKRARGLRAGRGRGRGAGNLGRGHDRRAEDGAGLAAGGQPAAGAAARAADGGGDAGDPGGGGLGAAGGAGQPHRLGRAAGETGRGGPARAGRHHPADRGALRRRAGPCRRWPSWPNGCSGRRTRRSSTCCPRG